MKNIPFFLIVTLFSLLVNFAFTQKKERYLIKEYNNSCSPIDGKHIAGYKIRLPAKGFKEKMGLGYCSYEFDKVYQGYNNEERMNILEELLTFEGDTSICAMKVCNYGSRSFKRPVTKVYTTQIDALYLLTVLSVASYSPNYCPFPVLYDKESGEEINNDQEKIRQVFRIYRKWVKENKKNGFVDFNVPLRNSRFEWYSTQKNFHYEEDSFKVPRLEQAARVVGVCID